MSDFHINKIETALENDKLFIFRVDELEEKECPTDTVVGEFLSKHNILSMIYAREYGSKSEKMHYHSLCILPDNVSYKYISDQFIKEVVKPLSLQKHQFSKKKNEGKSDPKYKAMKDAMEHFNMKWYDYLALYYSKDGDYKNSINPEQGSLKLKYIEFQEYLNNVKPQQKGSNHMKLLIDGWGQFAKRYEGVEFQHGVILIDDQHLDLDIKKKYVERLYHYIISYFQEHNKKSRLAQILSQPRVQQYMYTIIAYYHPVYLQDKDQSIINSFCF